MCGEEFGFPPRCWRCDSGPLGHDCPDLVQPRNGDQQSSTLTFTIPRDLWLSANRPIANHGHKSRIVRDLQAIAITEARRARLTPIVGRVAVDWTVSYPRGTRKDKGEASNSSPTTKALLDGLVKAKVLEDDGPAVVVWERFRRGTNLDRPGDHEVRLVLVPQEIPWLDGAA